MSDAQLDAAAEQQASSSSEFERERVPESRLLGFKSFVGMYAGEHCAGTELMIGPLFVAAGVSVFDLIVGLLLGNLLAVLSWMFLCAPIATRTRLTLYYQLEKICGRKLVILYNLANGVMFCFLAGSMITVSATAVGVWFKFPMPSLADIYPNSVEWCVAVFVIGALISVVAAFGYKGVSKFANIAAPWMVLVFLAFGVVALKKFMDASPGTEFNSAGNLWAFADNVIWRGGEPLPGQAKFTFWHVTFFAWFCNMAMHVGMSDLTVFRYAKKSWFGLAAGSGMYVGHFMAWIAASMLFAYQLHETNPNDYTVALLTQNSSQTFTYIDAKEQTHVFTAKELREASMIPEMIGAAMTIESAMVDTETGDDSRLLAYKQDLVNSGAIKNVDEASVTSPSPLPGPLAAGALGLVGLICVIIAGWTTANPTIYRAGLAFQAIMPKKNRVVVTLFTGLIATIAGMFPGIAMQLLGFVAIYGLLLMPMGAVIFVDFWLIKKFGLESSYAERSDISFNWAAGLTWFITLGAASLLNIYGGVQIYFVSLPGWFFAAVLYVVLSAFYQNKIRPKSE